MQLMSKIIYVEDHPDIWCILSDEVQELFVDKIQYEEIAIEDVRYIAKEFQDDICIDDLDIILEFFSECVLRIY